MSLHLDTITRQPRMTDFGSNKYLAGTKEFLESNSVVAKFAFILLILFIFVLFLRIGTSLLTWLFEPSSNPILIDGMISAKQMKIIPQNPATPGAIPILRSRNQPEGIAFTWSVWMLIDDLTYRQEQYKHVFHKGNDQIQVSTPRIGMNQPNNAPGLYIAPNTNDLVIVMNTFDKINEEIIISDIPIRKWINVIIRVNEQHQLDAYINGKLVKRHLLSGVPRQNYDDVYVAMNGGFSGYVSSLQYFSEAIGINKIQNIVNDGPNLKMLGNTGGIKNVPHYLSLRWFFSDANNMYNP
jgi:hypothetical protein